MSSAPDALPFAYEAFFDAAGERHVLWSHREAILAAVRRAFGPGCHGDFRRWVDAVEGLPRLAVAGVHRGAVVGIDFEGESPSGSEWRPLLMALQPWRKGPFRLGEALIDTEWRSDLKWDRVFPHLSPLRDRRVLDVGCGSGYHLWRMRDAGAAQVIGIDPTLLFLCQFQALQTYMADPAVQFLPLPMEAMPAQTRAFDTVFSMGVLYHRRNPLEHLAELRGQLRPGGELVLETLVVDGDERTVLVPEGRYACMGNVWFIPSVAMTLLWLRKLGWRDVRVVDVCRTTPEEQRATDWTGPQSLRDFLDPADPALTVEGHPAPVRAVFVATAY